MGGMSHLYYYKLIIRQFYHIHVLKDPHILKKTYHPVNRGSSYGIFFGSRLLINLFAGSPIATKNNIDYKLSLFSYFKPSFL